MRITAYHATKPILSSTKTRVLFQGDLMDATVAGHITNTTRTMIMGFTAEYLGISPEEWSEFGGITGIDILEELIGWDSTGWDESGWDLDL